MYHEGEELESHKRSSLTEAFSLVPRWTTGRLVVEILGARDLAAVDDNGFSDPFVTVRLAKPGHEGAASRLPKPHDKARRQSYACPSVLALLCPSRRRANAATIIQERSSPLRVRSRSRRCTGRRPSRRR